jgi:hypothetical protein
MPQPLTADDIIPLVASLTPQERVRLLRLIAAPQDADASVYQSAPPSRDEFSAVEEPLAWDAQGWEGPGSHARRCHRPSERTRSSFVPATRTIRGLTTEVVLTADDRMPAACALNFDHISLAQRNRIGPVLCSLLETRWVEVRRALLIACGFGSAEGRRGGAKGDGRKWPLQNAGRSLKELNCFRRLQRVSRHHIYSLPTPLQSEGTQDDGALSQIMF